MPLVLPVTAVTVRHAFLSRVPVFVFLFFLYVHSVRGGKWVVFLLCDAFVRIREGFTETTFFPLRIFTPFAPPEVLGFLAATVFYFPFYVCIRGYPPLTLSPSRSPPPLFPPFFNHCFLCALPK